MSYYKLNTDHSISKCSLDEWSEQLEIMSQENTKHVGEDIINGKLISTVWLGLDHSFFSDSHSPLLFETMVFDSPGISVNLYCRRYSTYAEALAGHQEIMKIMKLHREL